MSRRLKGDEPGLVSYWALNEGSGAIAQDKTANAYNGTILGNPTWAVSTVPLEPKTVTLPKTEPAIAPTQPAPPVTTPAIATTKKKGEKMKTLLARLQRG